MGKNKRVLYDIAVVGAGIVGMVVARCFSANGQSVLLIDKPVQKGIDLGEYPLTLRVSSMSFLQSLGFDLASLQVSAIDTLNVSSLGNFGSANIQDPGQKSIGIVTHISALAKQIQRQVRQDKRIDCQEAVIARVCQATDKRLTLHAEQESWDALRCVVADGVNSEVSQQFLGEVQSHPQPIQSIILPVQADHWSVGTALIRQDRQTVYGVVPGQQNHGWVIASTAFHETEAPHAWRDQYGAKILNEVLETRIGRVSITGAPIRQLSMLKKRSMIAQDRVIRLGNAALSTPPIGAQGLNLALQDCCELYHLQKRYPWHLNNTMHWQGQLAASCQSRHDFWYRHMEKALERMHACGKVSDMINSMAWALLGSNHHIQRQIASVGQGVF